MLTAHGCKSTVVGSSFNGSPHAAGGWCSTSHLPVSAQRYVTHAQHDGSTHPAAAPIPDHVVAQHAQLRVRWKAVPWSDMISSVTWLPLDVYLAPC